MRCPSSPCSHTQSTARSTALSLWPCCESRLVMPMQELMQAGWQSSFEPGQRLRARILYVDVTSKRVCLTLLPYLLAGQSAPSLPKGNSLFQVPHPCMKQPPLLYCPHM